VITNASNALLSRRATLFVGWLVIDEFEDLFERLCGWQIVVPRLRSPLPSPIARARARLIGNFAALDQPPEGGDLLLVVARTPGDLQMIDVIPDLRKRFRYLAALVIDSYFTEAFSPVIRRYDHFFSTTEEGAEEARRRFGVSTSVLRQGFDCLAWASTNNDRCVDLIGFGRQPPSYHRAFQAAFHQKNSSLLYLHSPIGTTSGSAVRKERPMLLKLLQRSKLSLAFNLGIEPQNDRPRSAGFVTNRWFESLATGSVVVGKRPTGPMAADLFPWEDSTIELDDDPAGAARQIEAISYDPTFLAKVRTRNVQEMCRRHDWRYRIRDIYMHFNLELPPALVDELDEIEELVVRLSLESSAAQ